MDVIESLVFRNLSSLEGGMIIGLAASGLLLFNGRIAGISGIIGALFDAKNDDLWWRIAFILGLLTGGAIAFQIDASSIGTPPSNRPLWLLAVASLFIGLGTGLARGCTSGHGICGLARLSPRSLVATISFMVAGLLTATVYGYIWGES